jgi:peptide/nickel transport system ATP-binding protein
VSADAAPPLLEVRDLSVVFDLPEGPVRAVDGISFEARAGRTLSIVGESGCGKSVTSLAIMRLLQAPGRIDGGSILFKGQDLIATSEARLQRIRGRDLSMVFQEPMTALNPVQRIGDQVAEVFRVHGLASRREASRRAVALLRDVGIPDSERRARSFPHELSGGMRQRVMIAIALALSPDLLVADEPTTALDVTVQAQVLGLMRDLIARTDTALLLITHDIGVVAEMADDVVVMYAGRIVERGRSAQVLKAPAHPYTEGLLRSIPALGTRGRPLYAIPGSVQTAAADAAGCPFADRCPHTMTVCRREMPPTLETDAGHDVRCWLHDARAVKEQHA